MDYDRYRPIVYNDGWEHTVSDIVTLHNYVEEGEDLRECYRNHLEEILCGPLYHNLHHSAFADGYSYCGQPVILSEFGGIAFDNREEGWGYGSKVSSHKDFIKCFDAVTTASKSITGFCGFCYTQVTDIRQEINGVMDIERNFKVEPEILKEVNEREVSTFHRIRRR